MKYRGSYGQGNARFSAEFTALSGTLAAGAESASDVTVTHSLGVTPSVVVGHLEDTGAGWAHEFGWRVASRTATTVAFRFRNNGPNSGSAVLRFRLIY